MLSRYLWISGSLIFLSLGAIHLFYTFFSDKFSPKNQSLIKEMKGAHPLLSKDLNMWDSWIGLNGSHSSGIIFIAVVNLYLAINYFSVLRGNHVFFLFNIFTIGFYVLLATIYWFQKPLIGTLLTFLCYFASYFLTLMTNK